MTTTDLNDLIDARDHVQSVVLEDAQASSWRNAATHLLDMVIMDVCPHDPATYTVEPLTGVLEDQDRVTCPVCRASAIRPKQTGTASAGTLAVRIVSEGQRS